MPLTPEQIKEMDMLLGSQPSTLSPEMVAEMDAALTPASTPQPAFTEGVQGDIAQRGRNLASFAMQPDTAVAALPFKYAAEAGGAVGDVALRGLKEVAPDIVQRAVGEGVEYIAGLEPVQAAAQQWQQFSQANPNAAAILAGGLTAQGVPVATTIGAAPAKRAGQALLERVKGRRQEGATPVKGETSPLFEDVKDRGAAGVTAFSDVRDSLAKEAGVRKAEINDLYTKAEQLGTEAFIPRAPLLGLANKIRTSVTTDNEVKGLYSNVASELDKFSSSKGKTSLNDLEALRRDLSRTSGAGGSKGFAAGELVRDIDTMLENADVVGNKDAVTVWKDAITSRKEYGRKFEKPTEILKALGEGANEEIERAFLGGGNVNTAKQAGRVYNDVLNALPVDDKEAAGFLMRQSVINNMVRRAVKTTDQSDAVSTSFMANQIKNLRTDNPTLWNKFTPDERVVLDKLEFDLRKSSKSGWVNRVGDAMLKIASIGGGKVGLFLPRTIKFKREMDLADVIDLTKAKMQKRRATPEENLGALAPASGVMLNEQQNNME